VHLTEADGRVTSKLFDSHFSMVFPPLPPFLIMFVSCGSLGSRTRDVAAPLGPASQLRWGPRCLFD
jgi:hypothetical protein